MNESSRHQSTRQLFAAVSIGAVVWNLWLASHHPVWPGFMLAASCAWVTISALRPGLWLVVLPAALPALNLSPWTGWLIFDEFDLLVAGAVSSEFARLACQTAPSAIGPSPVPPDPPSQRFGTAMAIALGGLALLGVYRGLGDAGGSSAGLFQGYTDALNTVRIVKSLVYALLLVPLLRRALRDTDSTTLAIERLTTGMLLGLGVVMLAVLWERAAHPGLLNFSSPYRTVALFWEMHVGGAAIDAYLALAAPFVAWALWSARSPLRWSVAAALALLAEYACLTTFSRGVYLAAIVPLVLLGAYLLRYRPARETTRLALRARAARTSALVAAMVVQAAVVLGSDSFMMSRIGDSERDLRSRLEHWRHGLGLLHTPGDWVLGTGLGRLPSRYAAAVPGGEFPGSVELDVDQGNNFARVVGPRTFGTLGGLYGLTQRVAIEGPEPRVAKFHVRATQATRLRLSVCEMHLLYERRCQTALVPIASTGAAWRSMSARLEGPHLTAGDWYAPRMGVFSVSVLEANSAVELDNLSLQDSGGMEHLQNGDFSRQLAQWFPVATNQFLPWHIDNLYLEILIERGVSGLAAFMVLVGCAAWSLAFGPGRGLAIAPFLLASLAGAMTAGLVSSIMDVPRVAFMLFLLVLFSTQLNARSKGD